MLDRLLWTGQGSVVVEFLVLHRPFCPLGMDQVLRIPIASVLESAMSQAARVMISFAPKDNHGAGGRQRLQQAELVALPSNPKTLPSCPVTSSRTSFAIFDVSDFSRCNDGEGQ